jgi:hypothetical protein
MQTIDDDTHSVRRVTLPPSSPHVPGFPEELSPSHLHVSAPYDEQGLLSLGLLPATATTVVQDC